MSERDPTHRYKIDGMAAGEKSLSELLREVAKWLDATASPQPEKDLQEQRVSDEAAPGPPSCHNNPTLMSSNANINAAMPHNPVQGK